MDQYGDPEWVGEIEVEQNDPVRVGVLPSSITRQWDLVYIDQDDKTIVFSCGEIDKFLDMFTRAKTEIEKVRSKADRKGE